MYGKHCWNSISAKNHFSGARACTCVTREQYGVSQIGLHSGIERYVRYNVISISKSEIIARWSIFPDIANAVMAGALVRTGPLQCLYMCAGPPSQTLSLAGYCSLCSVRESVYHRCPLYAAVFFQT